MMLLLAAMLLVQDAPPVATSVRVDLPAPRLRAVKVEPYQIAIVARMVPCMNKSIDGRALDTEAQDAVLVSAAAGCRDMVAAEIDAGLVLNDRERLTPRQRRDTIRALDETAENFRISRRHYSGLVGPDSPYLPQIDPNGPIARGVKVYDPVAKQFERYSACVAGEQRKLPLTVDRPMRVRGTEGAIASCAGLRAALAAESDAILARQPDFADAGKRKAAIAGMFDGYDEMTRAIARGEGMLPPRASTP